MGCSSCRRMGERAPLRVALVCLLGIALSGCGSDRRRDGGPTVVVDAGSVTSVGGDGGTDPGTLGSGVPDEAASDCGCDAPASDDASADPGDGTSSGDGGDSGGLGSGADGDGSGDLRAPPQGRWLTTSGGGRAAVSSPCIHGVVEDEAGRPVPGAAVSAALQGAAAETATATGRTGHFCLQGTLPPTAAVAVTAPDGGQVQLVPTTTQPLDLHGCVPVRAVFPAHR